MKVMKLMKFTKPHKLMKIHKPYLKGLILDNPLENLILDKGVGEANRGLDSVSRFSRLIP